MGDSASGGPTAGDGGVGMKEGAGYEDDEERWADEAREGGRSADWRCGAGDEPKCSGDSDGRLTGDSEVRGECGCG